MLFPLYLSKQTHTLVISPKHSTLPCLSLAHVDLWQDEHPFLMWVLLLDLLTTFHLVHTASTAFSHLLRYSLGLRCQKRRRNGRSTASSLAAYSFIIWSVYNVYAAQKFPHLWCHHVVWIQVLSPFPVFVLHFLSLSCSPSLSSILFQPKVVTSQTQPMFCLILLRVGNQSIKQKCAKFRGNTHSEACVHTTLAAHLLPQKHLENWSSS